MQRQIWVSSNSNARSLKCGTGWRRPIGCLKLQVIFRKRATDYRALLRKITYEDKASYDSTPLCTAKESHLHEQSRLSRYIYICTDRYMYIYINFTKKCKYVESGMWYCQRKPSSQSV